MTQCEAEPTPATVAVVSEEGSLSPEAQAYYSDRKLLYRNAFWLTFGSAAAGMGVNTADSLMPLHMSNIGLGADHISLIMAVRGWYGPFLLFYIAWKSDHCQMKMGRRLPFVLGTLPFIALGMLLFPYARNLIACLICYSIFRLALDIKWDAFPYLIYDIAQKKQWGRISGLHVTVRGLGVWIGQMVIMPLVPMIGEPAVYTLAALLLVVSTLLMVRYLREPPIRTPRPEKSGLRVIFGDVLRVGLSRRSNIVLFIAASLVISAGLPGMYVALQGQENLGLDPGQIGRNVLQWGTILSVGLAFAAGWVIDKLNPFRAICLGYTGILIASWYGYNPDNWQQLALAYAVMYGSTTLTYTGAIIFVVQGIDRSQIATFSACNGAVVLLMQSVYMLGAGYLVEWFGGNYGVVFPYGLTLLTLGLPLLFWIHRLRRRDVDGPAGETLASLSPLPVAVSAE